MSKAIRIVVGEPDYLTREGLARSLDAAKGLEVVAASGDAHALREAVTATGPDIVVTALDLSLEHVGEGLLLAEELRTASPEVGVVLLAGRADAPRVLPLFEGSPAKRAVLVRDELQSPENLVSAIREVAAGRSLVDATVVGRLLAAGLPGDSPAVGRLTTRERDVLQLVAAAASNLAIASELGITTRAVERHINSIFRKLGLAESDRLNRRVKAVLLYTAPSG